MRKVFYILLLAGLTTTGCATGQAGSAPAEFDETTNAVFILRDQSTVQFNLPGIPDALAKALFGESFNANQDFTVQPSSEGATASPTNEVEASPTVTPGQ